MSSPVLFIWEFSPRRGNASKLLKVFNSFIFFRLVISCVDCPSIVGLRKEIVLANGVVRFVNLFWCRRIVILKICSKWDIYRLHKGSLSILNNSYKIYTAIRRSTMTSKLKLKFVYLAEVGELTGRRVYYSGIYTGDYFHAKETFFYRCLSSIALSSLVSFWWAADANRS